MILKKIKENYIIIIVIIFLNTILLSLGYYSYALINKESYEKNVEHGMAKCSEVINDLDLIIYRGESIVDLTVRDYKYLYALGEDAATNGVLITQTFDIINSNTKYFKNLYLADDNVVISASDKAYEEFSPKGREWYDKALKTGDMVITRPYEDLYTKESVITISKRVGINNGVIGLDIPQDKISEIISNGRDSGNSVKVGFVINRDGIVIAHTDNDYTGLSIKDSKIPNSEKLKPYFNEIMKNDSGVIEFNQDGYAYSLIYQNTASDWKVAYVVDKKVLADETVKMQKQSIIYLIIAYLTLNLMVLVYYFKRQKELKLKLSLTEYKNHLEKMVYERTVKLEELNTAIIDNLADIVEFRDLESGQHIKRIKKFVRIIMENATDTYTEYKQYKDDIDKVCEVSALHDIGKIGIPDKILLKPGKLTVEEFEEMKKHTIIGGELALRILDKYDKNLKEFGYKICRYHHERYSGKGYPEGLKGEEIPFCAQIVGMADVYDALIEKRVYKEAIEHERAIQMILAGECGVFSEKLLATLMSVEKELEEIAKSPLNDTEGML